MKYKKMEKRVRRLLGRALEIMLTTLMTNFYGNPHNTGVIYEPEVINIIQNVTYNNTVIEIIVTDTLPLWVGASTIRSRSPPDEGAALRSRP